MVSGFLGGGKGFAITWNSAGWNWSSGPFYWSRESHATPGERTARR